VESFGEAGGISELVEKEAMDMAREKAAILARFQDLYRQGRARRIDRLVVERSDAVSPAFIDAVTELLEEVGGDPVRLLQALDAGDVGRFPSKKKDLLREFLLEEGFISDDQQLDEREIWVRLLAFVSRTKVSDEAARAFVAKVLGV
jgi:hypothetical protein